MDRSRLAGWVTGAVAVAIVGIVVFGSSTRRVELNLGPGDSPFVRGFEANSDVEDKVGWHWTTYDAEVHLPFFVRGADVDTTLRYARMFGEEAMVEVSVGPVRTTVFRARGGEIRTTALTAPGVSGPLVVGIKTDSHERRNMGLRMDHLLIDVRSGAPLRLTLEAAARPIVAAVLLFAGLLVLGASPLAAGGCTLLAALGFAARASVDLFAAWRQTQAAPEMLVLSVVALRVGRHLMERHGGLSRLSATWLVSGALITMLFRLTLVSHPDFYYPDLLTHTRVVEAIRTQGPSFFMHPAESLAEQKAWTKPVLGSVSALPYAVVFHTPFAILAGVLDQSIDAIETTLKAASSLVSVLPILISGVLAVRFGLPPLAALALAVIPTYTSRLSFALLPALTGHVFDLIVLATLAAAMPENRSQSNRSALVLSAALLAGHLAYTSSVVNEGLLMAALVILVLTTGKPGLPSAARLVVAEAIAAALAFALYYRHFVGDVVELGSRLVGIGPASASAAAGPTASQYPIESFWALLIERTNTFFGWPWLGLCIAGLLVVGSTFRRSLIPRAWVLAFLGLILLRAKIPDVFRYGHETLFLTPFVGLLAGAALILAWQRGGVARWASVGAGIALSIESFVRQWMSIAEQLGNAL